LPVILRMLPFPRQHGLAPLRTARWQPSGLPIRRFPDSISLAASRPRVLLVLKTSDFSYTSFRNLVPLLRRALFGTGSYSTRFRYWLLARFSELFPDFA